MNLYNKMLTDRHIATSPSLPLSHLQENISGGGKCSRLIGLDLLRICLAILVFLFHSHIHVLKCDYGLLNGFVRMGALAMTGFFLLSGYVLEFTSSNKDFTNIKQIKTFYIKRLITILPLYYSYALINVGINMIHHGKVAVIQELLLFPIETLGIQTCFNGLFTFSHNGGSWFISCILICYFFYPLLHVLLRAISNKARIIIIALCAFLLLWSVFVDHYFNLGGIYSNPFIRMMEFMIGVLVFQLNVKDENSMMICWLRKPIVCVLTIFLLIAGVIFAYYIGIPHDYMLYSWMALPCFISLLFSLGTMKFGKLQNSKVVRYLSDLSFSLFLSQLLIVWVFVQTVLGYFNIDSNLANICLSAIVCFSIANILHYCIERPCARTLKTKML